MNDEQLLLGEASYSEAVRGFTPQTHPLIEHWIHWKEGITLYEAFSISQVGQEQFDPQRTQPKTTSKTRGQWPSPSAPARTGPAGAVAAACALGSAGVGTQE